MDGDFEQIELIGISTLHSSTGAERESPVKAQVSPRTPTEETIAQIWARLLVQDQIGVEDNFFELGGSSVSMAQMLVEVGQRFGRKASPIDFHQNPTIAHLRSLLEQAEGTQEHGALIALQRSGTKRPLFMVPGGESGEAELVAHTRLAHYLDPDRPYYSFNAWRGAVNAAALPDVRSIAAIYLRDLLDVQPTGPYLLGGECMGGIVAYEMAQQLRAQGQQVSLLVMTDTPYPSRRAYWGRQLLASRLGQLLRLGSITFHQLSQLPQSAVGARLRYLEVKARNAAQAVQGVSELYANDSMIRDRQIMGERYARTLLGYHPRPYADRVALLVSKEAEDSYYMQGWQQQVGAGLTVYPVPGTHSSYMSEQIQATAECLRICLDAADSRS